MMHHTGKSRNITQTKKETKMKMRKEKTWQYEITGVDGNTFLFGVNIFDYSWTFIKSETLKDQTINIYSVEINDTVLYFGACEASNCVWDFYLFRY